MLCERSANKLAGLSRQANGQRECFRERQQAQPPSHQILAVAGQSSHDGSGSSWLAARTFRAESMKLVFTPDSPCSHARGSTEQPHSFFSVYPRFQSLPTCADVPRCEASLWLDRAAMTAGEAPSLAAWTSAAESLHQLF